MVHIEKLKATLDELQDELHAIDQLDPQTRAMLEATKAEVEATLRRDDPDWTEKDTLIERLEQTGRDFQQSHPTLARIVGNLVDVLGQMGI